MRSLIVSTSKSTPLSTFSLTARWFELYELYYTLLGTEALDRRLFESFRVFIGKRVIFLKPFADRRDYLIISVSLSRTSAMLLHYIQHVGSENTVFILLCTTACRGCALGPNWGLSAGVPSAPAPKVM